jgi:predicted AlkP superfamily pyrophosphatase or phosphodiesterase
MRHGDSAMLGLSMLRIQIVLALLIGFSDLVLAQSNTNNHVILITIDGLASYYLSDTNASLPTLRRIAQEGACATALRVSNPSTTWPNHTTLITGVSPEKHSVLFNGKLVREGAGRPVMIEAEHNQSELIAVPTLYDRLHRAGFRTAAVNWPCTRGAATLDDNLPDTPDARLFTTPRLRAELVRAGIFNEPDGGGSLKPEMADPDQMWAAAAIHILHVRPANLLLIHLLSTDVAQHRHGPRSPEAYAALARADARIAEIMGALRTNVMLDRTTVIVASDHGFARPSKLVSPNVVFRKAGLLRPGPRRRAQCVSEGGTAFVYLTNPDTAVQDREEVRTLLSGSEGVEQILEPTQYPALHLPDPSSNPQSGDLLLVARQGYTFGDDFLDDEAITPIPISLGSHGYLATDPQMNGVLLAWGRGIRQGTKLGEVDNVDVAPTISALLGQEMTNVEGKVIGKMIADDYRKDQKD